MKCLNLQTRKLENPKKINDVIRHNSTIFEYWVLEFEAHVVIFSKVAKSKETIISGKFCQILFFSKKGYLPFKLCPFLVIDPLSFYSHISLEN